VGGIQFGPDRVNLLGHRPIISPTYRDLPGFMEDLPGLVVVKRV